MEDLKDLEIRFLKAVNSLREIYYIDVKKDIRVFITLTNEQQKYISRILEFSPYTEDLRKIALFFIKNINLFKDFLSDQSGYITHWLENEHARIKYVSDHILRRLERMVSDVNAYLYREKEEAETKLKSIYPFKWIKEEASEYEKKSCFFKKIFKKLDKTNETPNNPIAFEYNGIKRYFGAKCFFSNRKLRGNDLEEFMEKEKEYYKTNEEEAKIRAIVKDELAKIKEDEEITSNSVFKTNLDFINKFIEQSIKGTIKMVDLGMGNNRQ